MAPPLTVSAFATQTRLSLAMVAPAPQSNEVEAALAVVDLLDLVDKTITADALHCHHRMAEAITKGKGHYILALKRNRPHWHAQAVAQFEASSSHDSVSTSETGHGRHEWRKAEIIRAQKALTQGHVAFIRISTKRDGKQMVQRYYMASMMMSANQALAMIRAHWRIENNLHWILDVQLGEDQSRARKDHAIANLALLKRITRNILQLADNPRVPISHRIKKCAWDDDYLINTIAHMR